MEGWDFNTILIFLSVRFMMCKGILCFGNPFVNGRNKVVISNYSSLFGRIFWLQVTGKLKILFVLSLRHSQASVSQNIGVIGPLVTANL